MWLLTQDILSQIEAAKAAGLQLTVEQVSAAGLSRGADGPMVVGSDAVIPIEGVLSEKPDFLAAWFGGGNTLYPDIIGAIAEANGDPVVERIVLDVGTSPGGDINGLFATMDAIRNSGKPVVARVKNMAASGAYGLVSQASEIRAANRGTQFGSVGVAYDTMVFSEEVSIASTESPNKRPDLTTAAGRQVVREQLDDYHAIFVEGIAVGRGTTVAAVNKAYGRGAIVLARDALDKGMIDAIGDDGVGTDTTDKQTALGGKPEVRLMDIQRLKAEHPDVYAAVVNEERDRVCAHLVLGKSSGDMATALTAVQDGSGMTATLQATYMAAAMNRQDVEDRGADNVDVEVAPEAQGVDTFDARVAAAWDAQHGEGEGVTSG